MKLLYALVQWTWGILQTLLGLFVFLLNIRHRHFFYHGALITVWPGKSSVSLGFFVFITDDPYFCDKFEGQYTKQELFQRLLVHEYGHTIQSLIFGPLFLLVMGIPSALWGFLPWVTRKRIAQKRSYFSFYTERFANTLGEFVTKSPSMEQLVID